MRELPAVVRLRSTLTVLAETRTLPASDQRALQEQVCDVVDLMRGLGLPPERVIIGVKEIAAEAGLRPSRLVLSRSASLDSTDELISQLVRWCIERYFAQSEQH